MPAHRSNSRRGHPTSGGCLSVPVRTAAEVLGTVAAMAGALVLLVWFSSGGDDPLDWSHSAAGTGKPAWDAPLYDMAVSDDESRVLLHGMNQPATLRELPGERILRELPLPASEIFCVALSPDGNQFAAGMCDGSVVTGDLSADSADGEVRRLDPPHPTSVGSIAFSPDGRLIVSGSSRDHTSPDSAPAAISIWNALDGTLIRRFERLEADPSRVRVAAGNAFLLAACFDGTVRLWDLATGATRVFHGHTRSALDAAISPDGRMIVSGSTDGTARVWDIATGREVWRLEPQCSISAVAFSPDARTIAAANGDTGAIYVAIVGAGSTATVLDGHERLVSALQFSTDGERLYSASHDGTFRAWRLPVSPRT